MTWRDILPVHPAADALPLLDAEQLRELANDLKKNGLLEPPVVWREGPEDGRVYRLIDGRNRLDAIELLCGAPILKAVSGYPPFERVTYHFEDRVTRKFGRVMPMLDLEPITHGLMLGQSKYDNVTPDDPAAYVISRNLKRRHLRPRDLVLHAMAVRTALTGSRSRPIGTYQRRDDGLLTQTRTYDRVSGGRGKKGEATEIAEQTGVPARTVRRVLAESRSPLPPKPHDYSADLRAGTNKLMSIVHAVRDERWAPDVTEATLLLFLARALTEIAQTHGASVEPGNVIDEIEMYLATEGRLP